MATINDVARASGVSPTTVSFVLNNGPRPVSERTRQRVLEAMRRLNYRPSAVARGLARQKMETIGVLFSGHNPRIIHNPYAVALLDGIVAAASTRRYNVTLITQQWETPEELAAEVCDGRNDGILLLSPLLGADVVMGLAERNMPVVVAGAPSAQPGVPWLDVDNEAGARLLARHILELGHRRVALFLGPREYHHVNERERGFLAELTAAGVVPIRESAPFAYADAPTNARRAEALLAHDPRPTAVLTTNDQLAMDILRAARARGLDVPRDLSVTGFDDALSLVGGVSQLTTIRQPLFDIGYAAAERLVQQIENREGDGDQSLPPSLLFPPELVVRGSTAAPPPPDAADASR
jgi:Transcriptional regulators